ncbi:MAG: D-glycerate dehydrogenase [Planctomycetaceae bacterium]|nr:D-glycerate dehydrogenase [Planctomycetaceae bacterium]
MYRVIADGPLGQAVLDLMGNEIEVLPWSFAVEGSSDPVDAVYTYGHPQLNGEMLDRLTGVKVISNYGVGVDHINVPDAAARGVPVGNTPDILNGATADMGFALMLAAGRRIMEGVRYARSSEFTVYDPGYMLGREIHSTTLGIIGMGSIGEEVAKRARAFNMTVLYHNRNRKADAEASLGVRFVSSDELLADSDYVMLCVPLTDETRGLIGAVELTKMKSTAILINIARGPIVDTDALTAALRNGDIYAAGLDVTDPEPLPRDHPLLQLDNVTIAPHLGSATEQTRRQMAEISVENLFRGLRGEELLHEVMSSN